MSYSKNSMAITAMVFVFIIATILMLVSCGGRAYENVATGQRNLTEAEDLLSSPEHGETSGRNADEESPVDAGGPCESALSQSEASGEATIFVYVCGAVKHPGVYELPKGSRVFEAVDEAGGLAGEADGTHTNLAAPLVDGQQVTIYTKEETAGIQGTAGAEEGQEGDLPGGATVTGAVKVNINTASSLELQTLNGVGASRAADIIAYREANGPFATIEDIMKVPGIKTSLFNRFKDCITVS